MMHVFSSQDYQDTIYQIPTYQRLITVEYTNLKSESLFSDTLRQISNTSKKNTRLK